MVGERTDAIGKAASVLIVRDDPFSVLMVQRRDSGQYASAHVFPGGAVETFDFQPDWGASTLEGDSNRAAQVAAGSDDLAYARAAIRETWEEVGLVIAADSATVIDTEFTRSGARFGQVVSELNLSFVLDELHYFGHWLAPVDMPKRWDTRFLLTRAPAGQEPVIDGDEITAFEWITPQDALRLHESRERLLFFPTVMNLRRLAEATTVDEAIAQTANHPRQSAVVAAERTAEGVWRRIPESAGYGIESHWTPNPPNGSEAAQR